MKLSKEQQDMVVENINLVYYIAGKYGNYNERADIIGEGMVGITKKSIKTKLFIRKTNKILF